MRRESLLLSALVAVGALVPAVGCNRRPAPPGGGGAPAPAAPQIKVVKPEMRAIKREVEQPGTVQAFEETVLHAKVTGYVTLAADPNKKAGPEHDRLIDIGSRVSVNQVLATLAVPELDADLVRRERLVDQAAAEVTQAAEAEAGAKAGVDAAHAGVDAAKAGVERAAALAERGRLEVVRIEKQVRESMGDQQTLDEVKAQHLVALAGRKEADAKQKAAEAALAKATADQKKATADTAAAKARLEVAKADLDRVRQLVEYKQIKAPFDGIVTRRAVNTRDLVTEGDKVVLFAVARVSPVRVVVNVPEADAGLVTPGQEVKLTLQGAQVTGKVARTSWSLEPGSRTLRTEIDVPNEKGDLRPGSYAYAKLTAELPAGLAVPATAVGRINDEPVMYLVEGGKAVRVSVQLGRGDSQFTQVRKYRRAGGDWTDVTGAELVATPAAALTDGQPVP